MEKAALDGVERDRVIESLAACPLFRALKPEVLPKIMNIGEICRYAPDEVIIRQGDPSDAFFVIVEGEASVRTEKAGGESVELGRMPPKTSVGEIGLLLNTVRTASVIASQKVVALKFNALAFDGMFQKIPQFGQGVCQGLAHRLSEVSGKSYSLPSYDTAQGAPSAEVMSLLPMELCQRHRVLPLNLTGSNLTLGLVDEATSQLFAAIRQHLPSLELRPLHIDLAFFNKVMSSHAGVKGWSADAGAVAAGAEVSRSPRLDAMLARMVAEGASDLHLSAGQKPYWRIDGDVRAIADAPPLGSGEALELIEPVLEDRHKQEFADEKDADFAYAVPGLARFRVNLYRDSAGSSAALRLIPSTILTVEQLGLPPALKSLCEYPKGLILVTGPTGSGKSTTVAAMVDHIIKTKKVHLVTLEDPIEFVYKSDSCLVHQREVGAQVKSFSRGLRAALREDPDIVLVGELRDPETVALALEIANTGHLVLATLHTNSAVTALDRISDQFPGDQRPFVRATLGDVLRGVVAQTLCKKIGGGRIAVCEVMIVNLAISNLIREGKSVQIPNIMQTSRGIGMSLLNDEMARLVEAKKVEMTEALSKAVDKDDFLRRFRSGMTIDEDPPTFERIRVVAVRPGSPASEAGFHRGDLIVEINGKPAKDHTIDEARAVLRADVQPQFTVERAGKRSKIALDLRR